MSETTMRPLAGVRVLALENFVAGPTATMFLADWGADVVKIEPPTGDTYRSFPPIKSTESAVSSVWFSRLNRGKRSVVLELATGAGRERFLELASVADVLVQNLRPGTLAKLGLDYETLSAVNPRLILVSISGFGQPDVQAGPYTKMPAFDLIGQAMSGIAYTSGREGDPPSPVGFPLIDTSVGDWAVTATLLALYQRERTGLGQHLDVAMFDVGIHLNEYAVGAYGWHGVAPLRGRLPSSAPFELVRASEGYVAIAVSGEAIFARFAEVIGHPELATDPRYANGTLRASAMDDHLLPLIERWTGERSVSEIVAALGAAGVPASPVQGVADLFEDEHVAARDMIVRVPDEVLGEVRVAGNPVKGTRLPPLEPRSSPQLGADTDDVLAEWLGSTRNDPDERETT